MKGRLLFGLLLVLGLLGANGCMVGDAGSCAPGEQRACSCLGSLSGVQQCAPEGLWDGCVCSQGTPPTQDAGNNGTPGTGTKPPSDAGTQPPPDTGAPPPDVAPPPPPKVTCPGLAKRVLMVKIQAPRGQGHLVFHPEGKILASNPYAPHSGNGEGVLLWDLPSGKLRTELKGEMYAGMVFHPNGKHLYTGGFKGKGNASLKVWNVADGALQKTLSVNNAGYVTRLVISPDGKTLGGVGTGIWLWDTATLQQRDIPGQGGTQRGIAFNPLGTMMVTAGDDRNFTIWRVSDGKKERAFPFGQNYSYNVAWRPGTQQVVTMSTRTGNVTLWDSKTGKAIHEFQTSGIMDLAVSPDGKALALATGSGVDLWNLDTGKQIERLTDLTRVQAVAFSPQGFLAASGGQSIHVWHCNP